MKMVVVNFASVNSCKFILFSQFLTESYIEKKKSSKDFCAIQIANLMDHFYSAVTSCNSLKTINFNQPSFINEAFLCA